MAQHEGMGLVHVGQDPHRSPHACGSRLNAFSCCIHSRSRVAATCTTLAERAVFGPPLLGAQLRICIGRLGLGQQSRGLASAALGTPISEQAVGTAVFLHLAHSGMIGSPPEAAGEVWRITGTAQLLHSGTCDQLCVHDMIYITYTTYMMHMTRAWCDREHAQADAPAPCRRPSPPSSDPVAIPPRAAPASTPAIDERAGLPPRIAAQQSIIDDVCQAIAAPQQKQTHQHAPRLNELPRSKDLHTAPQTPQCEEHTS